MSETKRLAAGAILDDRYRIDELLSVGGMGAVYAGTHTQLQKRVAIKVLRTEAPASKLMVDRFRREAIAASGIGHENIVEVTDMAVTADGTAYLVMELLEGHDLAAEIEANTPLSVERACGVAASILRGLGAAHRAGIVHRDLKPENVFLARKPNEAEVVKVLDFGISLLESGSQIDARLTSTGTVLGTPRYMSPEQARGEQALTSAVDVYALGVVLYEMLTGHLPYLGNNYNTVIHEIIAAEWAPLEGRRPELPAELVGIVHKAMALAPEDRFESADAMADQLERFASGVAYDPTEALAPQAEPAPERPRRRLPKPSDSLIKEPAWTASKPKAPAPAESGELARIRPSSRGPGRWIAMSALGMGAIAALALILSSGSESEAPESTEAEEMASADPSKAGAVSPSGADPAQPEPSPAEEPQSNEPGEEAEPARRRESRSKRAEPAAKRRAAERERAEKGRAEKRAEKKPAPQPERVSIELLIVPPTAKVTVRGRPVPNRRLVLERGGDPVPLRIEAPGYLPKTLTVTPTRSRELIIQLDPRPEEPEGADPETPKPPDDPEAEEEASEGTDPGESEGEEPESEEPESEEPESEEPESEEPESEGPKNEEGLVE